MSLQEKRIQESTPLEDRDEIAAFQARRDREEATPAAEKYKDVLKDKNQKYYDKWCVLFNRIQDALKGHNIYLNGLEEFTTDAYLRPTGYYDSSSFDTSDGICEGRCNSEGIGVYLWGAYDGGELGGDVWDEFLPEVKRAGGAELILIGFWALNPHSERYHDVMDNRNRSPKQVINLHIKDMLDCGFSRKDIAAEAQFLNKLAENGDARKEFPGCTQAYLDTDTHDNIEVLVFFNVSPFPTDEEISNVASAVKKLADNMYQITDFAFE